SAGAKHLAEIYEKVSTGKDVVQTAKIQLENEKSTGDKVLETGVVWASHIPGVGPFVNTIAGMMFETAIANDASRVTKLRSRCYVYFVAGYINQLALADTGLPGRKLDKKYFDLGAAAAPKPNSPDSFNAQLSLMHYASEHYTDGGWRGL